MRLNFIFRLGFPSQSSTFRTCGSKTRAWGSENRTRAISRKPELSSWLKYILIVLSCQSTYWKYVNILHVYHMYFYTYINDWKLDDIVRNSTVNLLSTTQLHTHIQYSKYPSFIYKNFKYRHCWRSKLSFYFLVPVRNP